jgi:hypothetical protein
MVFSKKQAETSNLFFLKQGSENFEVLVLIHFKGLTKNIHLVTQSVKSQHTLLHSYLLNQVWSCPLNLFLAVHFTFHMRYLHYKRKKNSHCFGFVWTIKKNSLFT